MKAGRSAQLIGAAMVAATFCPIARAQQDPASADETSSAASDAADSSSATNADTDPAAASPLPVIPVGNTAPPPVAVPPPESQPIAEIVVTASYREQSNQDVVGSTQVFSGADLDKKGAAGLKDYLLDVPNVSLQSSGNGSQKISMRGISNVNSSDLGYGDGSPTTGVYLNDVGIQGSGVFPDLDIFDLQRIEVLKGPQGTLYGEGSMGGSLKMVTNAPDMSQWIVRTQASLSNTSDGAPSNDERIAVNVPIVQDRLAARVVGNLRHNGGFVDYTTLDRKDADADNHQSARAIVDWQAWDSMLLEYTFLYDNDDRKQFPVVDAGAENELTNSGPEDQYAKTRFTINALTARWSLPFAQLTSVSAVYNTDRDSQRRVPVLQGLVQTQVNPLGITAPPIFSNSPTHVVTGLQSFSQELRLVSNGDERLDWIAGLFYRNRSQSFDEQKYENAIPDDPTGILEALLGPFNPVQGQQENGHGDEKFKQIAAYGELNYEILPSLELTGGLRLFSEDVSFFIDTQFYGIEAYLLATDPSNVDPQTGAVTKYFSQSVKTSGALPKLSLSWHITDDHMLYATLSRGFRSGTPNVYSALDSGPPVVKPDYVWNEEIGAKLSWFHGHLITNLSAYRIDWQNLQATVVGTARLGAVSTQFAHLDNAGDAVVLGTEASITWAPFTGMLLSLNGGYSDGNITKPAANSETPKGSRVPSTPRYTWSATGSYDWPVFSSLLATLSAGYSYIGDQLMTLQSGGTDGFPIASYDSIKASAAIGGENWQVQLYGNNLANKHSIINISAPTPQYTIITPRTYGIRLSYDF
ncbi:TonB-dependent receptor [Solimonas terrae]|uniref:TonB-dependent receptor n=1 Tax=Solimonas terrae TaxID=1396819 RepID=A0A6M2BME9_9GAMM|nr:TonB-dependent receptor [Solimonas terrae]NGY03183.1 TonB-dependent receptor [Solimonas terrae]